MGAMVFAFDVRPEVAEQIESMGAEFVFLEFEEDQQDGAATGGYAAPSSPIFREKQLEKFRELAPDMDIVITTALIPGRDAPKLWLKDMVAAMKPGSVIVDLAAERGGNCDLTVADEKIVTDNGVTIIGYTDLPARMAAQSSTLYATNIRHMMTDLTPKKDGKLKHDMKDDVIRGATATHKGKITFPPPPPKIAAIAVQKPKAPEKTTDEIKAEAAAAALQAGKQQTMVLVGGGLLMLLIGAYAPASFMQHFIVFVLSCFIGFPSDLESQPCVAHAAYGNHKCYFRHHHTGGFAANRRSRLYCDRTGRHQYSNRNHQHRRRLYGHQSYVANVPKVLRGMI